MGVRMQRGCGPRGAPCQLHRRSAVPTEREWYLGPIRGGPRGPSSCRHYLGVPVPPADARGFDLVTSALISDFHSAEVKADAEPVEEGLKMLPLGPGNDPTQVYRDTVVPLTEVKEAGDR
ncbi:unnamed protein product, partial [Iphiclides podalirius]